MSHTFLRTAQSVILALVLATVSCQAGCPALARPDQQRAVTPTAQAPQAAQIEQLLKEQGAARVVVALRLPYISASVSARKAQVAQAQSQVISALATDQNFQVVYCYQTVPGLVGLVTAEGLDRLRRYPDVQAVALDMQVHTMLSESVPLIRADRVWSELGLTGAGINIAVVDTGVDRTHPDLADHIVAQHCFNHGTCPPNGADENDNAQDEHGHGTHVAGIIASRGGASPRGVAPGAGIVAVRVVDGSGSGWNSDVVAGLDWIVVNHAQFNIRVINMSLGAGRYSEDCDAQDANTMLQAATIGAARQAGMVVFAASGNEGLTDHMAAPACIAGVVSVGASYDANLGAVSWSTCSDANAATDQVTCFSNSAPGLDLLAPGAVIVSTAPGGGRASKSGTSQASPHAAATAALMLQAYPNLTPAEIEAALKGAGAPVTDRRTGRVTPRINALAAVTRVISDHVSVSGTVLLQSSTIYSGTMVYVSQATCPPAHVIISGTPSAITNSQGRFEMAASPGVNYQCLQAVRRGYLIGQKSAPHGHVGSITLPGGEVTGDDAINIFDLTLVAGRFGSSDPTADVNHDGVVNIFDLALIAGNLGQSGPATDWR